MTQALLMAVVGFAAGAFGSMVGLGGGVFVVPILSLFLGVPIHQAVGASLMAVVATSSAASIAYMREELTNVRLGMTLQTTTVAGALAGGLVGTVLSRQVLSAVFGGVMVTVSIYLLFRSRTRGVSVKPDDDSGILGASYFDKHLGRQVTYRVHRLPLGMGVGLLAGVVSGLLGVGGGFLIVPLMILGMRVPVRAAVATSTFMLGMTVCGGATVYLARGMIDPVTTAAVVIGVVAGAYPGSKIAQRVHSSLLTVLLALMLLALAVQMILAAAGISLR